ncbi:MAG: hypothetical protein COA43_09240 [Robiginitomaculum sp.]|nr:MAG: hypothetical protein COA43_09240 [Robiginitomaculum sp.]
MPPNNPNFIAPNVDLVSSYDTLDYFDLQSISLPKNITALAAWDGVMSEPLPLLSTAFRVRDFISAKFGVKKIGGFSGARHENLTAGDKIDFFLIEKIDPNILTLTARDKHLDVMTCVTTTKEKTGSVLEITSSVVTHNLFGKIYMLPVGVFHRIIVKQMLKRVRRKMQRA